MTTTQVLGNGDDCTVEEGGSIDTSGFNADGIFAPDGDNRIENRGSIRTNGAFAEGIDAEDDNDISNSGSIRTLAADAEGIDAEDRNIISNTGSIRTFGVRSIGIEGDDNNQISSDGSIDTFGVDADGIEARDDNDIDNSGNINTDGVTARGIEAGDSNRIYNSGNITTRGLDARGIEAVNGNSIFNSGNIDTTGGGARGIEAGDNNTVDNSGKIRTRGLIARGIEVGDGNNVTNRGTIKTSGVSADGIRVTNNNTVTNRGSIKVSGSLADAVSAGDNTTLTNRGLISATGGGTAIDFGAGNNNLILQPGSRIVGAISLGNDTDTLTVENGLSIDHTFAAPNNGPEVINTNGAPFVVERNRRVIVVDPTGFASAQTWLSDITRSIFNAVDGSLGNFGNSGESPGATSETAALAPAPSAGPLWPRSDRSGRPTAILASLDGTPISTVARPDDPDDTGLRVWATGFGGYRDQEGDGAAVDVDHTFGGGFAAVEAALRRGFSVGLLGGGAYSDLDAQHDSGNLDVVTAFGGIYGRHEAEQYWINLVVIGGHADFDSRRRVANNLVNGGIEEADGDYDGYFIAPAVTVGTAIEGVLPDHSILPSLRVQYAGLFLDSYEEDGVAAPLDVDSREIHLIGGRAQLAVPHDIYGDDGARYRIEGRLGMDAQFVVGDDDVDASVAALPISFSGSFEDNVGSGFFGASLTRTSADGRFFLKPSIEGHFDTDGSKGVRGFFSTGLSF